MKVPIRVTNIEEAPDGSAKVCIEFDDDVKHVLMKAWGITEWDDERANKEFLKVIRESLNENKEKYASQD